MPETPKKDKDQKGKSRKKKVAKFTPRTARTVAFALSNPVHRLPFDSGDGGSGSDADDSDENSKRNQKRRKRKARSLNRVTHSKEKGWKRVGSSHTTEVYKTFEQWVRLRFTFLHLFG